MPHPVLINGGTSKEWEIENPILPASITITETDTGRKKVGNGSSYWNSLKYTDEPSGYDILALAVSDAIRDSYKDVNIGVDSSHNWGEQTAEDVGAGLFYFPGIKKLGYSDAVNFKLINPLVPKKRNTGMRILAGRMGAFDNSTVKTFRAIIELAAPDYDAIQVIFANGSPTVPYTVGGCLARAPAALTDSLNGMAFKSVTLPSSGVVPVSLSANRRTFFTSDWIDISSLPRTDGGSGALIAIDAYVSTASSITIMGNGTNDTLASWATRSGRKWIMRHNDGNGTANSALMTSTTNQIQSPIVGVRYVSKGKVISVMGIGDSITEGRGTIVGEGFGVPACEQAQESTGVSYEWANCGWSSMSPTNYRLFIDDVVTAGILPDVVVFPTGSPNNVTTLITELAITNDKQSVSYIMRACDSLNIPVILWTWLPSNYSSKPYGITDTMRIAHNQQYLNIADDGLTIDMAAALSGAVDVNGQMSMLTGTTSDNIHPNDAGNEIMKNLLSSVLKLA